MRTHGNGGYTLIELLIILSIVSILSAFGIEAFGKLISNAQQFDAIHATISSLNRTRTFAVNNNERVGICNLTTSQTCSSNWDGNYLIGFIDSNRNQTYDRDEEVVL